MPSLFDPITIGAITCPNRIFMAPLTRGRATREHPSLTLGVSPRGATMLLHAAKAWAWLSVASWPG